MALCLREVAVLQERREFRQIPGYREHLMASVVTTDKVMAGVLLQNLQLCELDISFALVLSV